MYGEIVLEYLEGGAVNWTLDEAGKPQLPIHLARRYFRDVVLGLEYRINIIIIPFPPTSFFLTIPLLLSFL